MDRIHIDEFGSDRYIEKINQSQVSAAQLSAQAADALPSRQAADILPSRFILPIRGSIQQELSDEPNVITLGGSKRAEKDRKGFLGLRSKFHPRGSSSSTEHAHRRPSLAESTSRQSLPFDQLFQYLPNELQVEIIASLPLSDILNLRLASRSMHALVSYNETPIARYHLDHHVPAYAKRLYPVPEGGTLNFHYLCGIWHRLHVAAKLSDLMCEWISNELFLRNTEEKKRDFAAQRERMRRRLIPLLFTVFHFFETYRKLHLKYLAEHDGKGLLKKPYTVNPIEAEIMSMYDDRTLLRVHEAFPLVISSFCRRLRPPSYVGRVERSLRGYLREKPPDEVHVAILCIGGLREVERIWEVKGYNARRAAVDEWYGSMTRESVEPEQKKRRGMLGLKRKKSSFTLGKGPANDATGRRGSSDANATNTEFSRSFVFNTSLAAGMPMSSLTKEQSKMLLSDLPVLQKIWMETAEAMILDRKIVERPSDIRRNAQIFTDLIREDGVEEDDQWWYGTVAPESVRPNLDAIEEDPLE
ncbi:hypothetical protein B0T25DRAFT_18442 [Lasiosphaeria hispida]|uniref:F-box domain-containing protein n=1 Tax=Lasiosphaeria hispida TaxID=260671 RepID=A0AAJ0HTX0_9PEZI|nr:hypothetical protein B0T25DRAFT_18442 [Lasiosphaeria hispida]